MSILIWVIIAVIVVLVIVALMLMMHHKKKVVSGTASAPAQVPKMAINAFGA